MPTNDAVDTDHEMVDRLIAHHPPASPDTVATFEYLREQFRAVAHDVVDRVPRTPDRTVALRKIHEACMASIGALACNQGLVNQEDP